MGSDRGIVSREILQASGFWLEWLSGTKMTTDEEDYTDLMNDKIDDRKDAKRAKV